MIKYSEVLKHKKLMSKITKLLLATFCLSPLFVSADQRPNIIFLFSDDQNLLSVGCYGNPEVQTPNMDKLGADGVIFDKHYNTTSICMASRANVMVGMYEYKTGTNFGHGDMSQEIWQKSYPILLKKAGYKTAFAGKFGFKIDGKGYDASEYFDVWGGGPLQTSYKTAVNKSMAKYAKDYPHSTLSYAAFGKDFIKESAKKEEPFCLSISFKAPHHPVSPDPQFNHIYEGKAFTKPANFGREAGAHRPLQMRLGRQYDRFSKWGYKKQGYGDNYNQTMAKYYQQVYAIDVAVGMIRKELAEQNIEDNTIIIYTSDNGFICGSHGFGSKVLPIEESARVPLMIFDPRSDSAGKGLRSKALTGNIDFAPTILELAGVEVPQNMDGLSLTPLLENPNTDIREQMAFINVFGKNACLTSLTKDHKYTYWWQENDKMKATEELYNLTEDPLEMNNLSKNAEAKPLLDDMRARYDVELEKWRKEFVSEKYKQYVTIFDRNKAPDEKKFKDYYTESLKK